MREEGLGNRINFLTLYSNDANELQKETKVAEESIVYITDSATERIPMWYKCFFAEEQFIIAVPKLVKVCEFVGLRKRLLTLIFIIYLL